MEKKYIIIGLAILLIGGIIAGGSIAVYNKDITLSKQQKDILKAKGIEKYKIADTLLSPETMERCLISYNDFMKICETFDTFYKECKAMNKEKTECIKYEIILYTENELKTIMDNWETERIKFIADAYIERELNKHTKVRDGETTIR